MYGSDGSACLFSNDVKSLKFLWLRLFPPVCAKQQINNEIPTVVLEIATCGELVVLCKVREFLTQSRRMAYSLARQTFLIMVAY